MKKFATHMGRKVRISENALAAKPLSVDEITRKVYNKFPSAYKMSDPMLTYVYPKDYSFNHGVNVREVVLFVRKLCRK